MISCAGNKSNFEEKIKALWEERLFRVRPAAHVSNRCKSGIRPVVGRI